jgi:DNA-binding LacI/PurR family transcriptional regulator
MNRSMPSYASAREELAHIIRQQIFSGKLEPGAKLESARSLTKRHGFGYTTTVAALGLLDQEGYVVVRPRKGTYISEQGARRVQSPRIKILTGLYAGAASLSAERSHLDGMEIVERKLMASGSVVSFQGCVCYPYGDSMREYVPLRHLGVEDADAIIAAGLYDMTFLGSLHDLKKPVIVYDLDASALRVDSTCIDDTGSAFEMTSLLIKRGHRKIAFLGEQKNTRQRNQYWNYDPCLLRRADGYSLAMRTHGLAEHLFFKENAKDGAKTISRALAAIPGCDAFVKTGCFDLSAIASEKTAIATWTPKGMAFAWPGVAIIAECDFDQMGEAVLKLLDERLANPEAPIQRAVIRPKIKVWKKGKLEA